MINKYGLNNNWRFKLFAFHDQNKNYHDSPKLLNKWHSTAIPSTIYSDLLRHKIISDPYFSDNEQKTTWIDECDWIYETEFELGDLSFDNLVFEGVDTISEIRLNGISIGKTNNMFRKYVFKVKKYLQKKNLLQVIIFSPLRFARAEEKKYGRLPVALNPSRVYIRKAQYSFGWDWGPNFPNSGIWRGVYLAKDDKVSVENIAFDTVEIKANTAKIHLAFNMLGPKSEVYNYSLNLSGEASNQKYSGSCKTGFNQIEIIVRNPELWWPNGYGRQNLYNLEFSILKDEKKILTRKIKVGIRKVELVLKENRKETFKFLLNNEPLFIKGANWIPLDTFLDRPKRKNYEDLVLKAKEANMNMLRVWGGGIYETDHFYQLCSQHGLLIWQDFMFACGAYPNHKEFIENVKKEVIYNVNRIRNNPALALWCGNNENEWIWAQEQETHYSKMPGYKIYHKIIPGILNELRVHQPYWPSSPFGNDLDPNSQTSGNRHQWYIWSQWQDYNTVINDNSHFVSEFGFQGPANKDTIEGVIPKKERYLQSRAVEHHNKQVEGQERIIRFLTAHLPLKTDWEDFLYLAQLNQGLALKKCLEHWRCNTKTNGTIIWQINDVWPVTSWSLIDSKSDPKMSYHFVKSSFSNIFSSIYFADDNLTVNIRNESPDLFKGYLVLESTDLVSGESIVLKKKKIITGAESENVTRRYKLGENELITSTIIDESSNQVHRNFYMKNEWKYTKLVKQNAILKIDAKAQEVIIKAGKLLIFGDLYCKGIQFAERGFILLKGESMRIKYASAAFKKIKLSDLKLYSLNKYLS